MSSRLRFVPKRPIGRPKKYGPILHALEDNSLYTPALITMLAVEKGFIQEKQRTRLRGCLSKFSRNQNHAFPIKGDGQVTLPGQPPTPAFWGHRWKAYAQSHLEEA